MNSFAVRAVARALALVGLAVSLVASAEDATSRDDVQRVVVSARQGEPEQKPYRELMAQVAKFEAYHQRHPDVQLRFRLYARKPGVDMTKLSVYVMNVETGQRWPIQLADDDSFTLPDVPADQRPVVMVRTNVQDGLLAWAPRVVRTGGDAKRRPLGDIRTECRLNLDGARIVRAIITPALLALRAAGDLCTNKSIYWVDYSDQPLFAVHVRYQGRELSLLSDDLYGGGTPAIFLPALDWSYLLKDRAYRPPIYDTSWPDEAEVNLVYVTDEPQRVSKQ